MSLAELSWVENPERHRYIKEKTYFFAYKILSLKKILLPKTTCLH